MDFAVSVESSCWKHSVNSSQHKDLQCFLDKGGTRGHGTGGPVGKDYKTTFVGERGNIAFLFLLKWTAKPNSSKIM